MSILDFLRGLAGTSQRSAARQSESPGWSRVDPVLRITAGAPARALRSYMAASNDRLVADLMSITGMASGNAEVRMGLRTMRMRSRQLSNDNEYVKRFLQLLRNSVVGPRGLELQMKIYKARRIDGVQQLDRGANDTIEAAYADMSKVGVFSACGQLSRAAFERAVITGLARDGEVIIEKLIGREFNRFGIAWRLIDPDLLDDALNVGVNGAYPGFGKLDQGHTIRMGVERNAYGRAVAYWFHSAHPGDDVVGIHVARHRRVTADRIIHRFMVEELRPETSRGVPWIYAALRRMAMLSGYEEAALVSARQGASKMGFYKKPLDHNGQPDLAGVASSEDAQGNLVEEAEPGVFGVLPAGWDFTTYDPAYPNDKMEDFVRGMLRAFCASVGLNYNGLTGDLMNVSLSAMRHGANADRDTFESIQEWFREHIAVPMFEPWLMMGLDMGQIGGLPADAYARFNYPRFIARPFRSPDPQKDIAAAAQAVSLGVRSRTRICAESGDDFEEVLEELAREESMAREKGVTLNTESATATKTPRVDQAGKPAKPGEESADAEDSEEEDDAATEQ